MSRDIKFRAWDKRNNKWIYGPSDGVVSPSWVLTMCTANNLEPSQFTGLLDKNGVEIYEGDILSFHVFDGIADVKGNMEVKFIDGAFRLAKAHPISDYITNGEIEIIGNIHQHPSLLGVDQS